MTTPDIPSGEQPPGFPMLPKQPWPELIISGCLGASTGWLVDWQAGVTVFAATASLFTAYRRP